MNDEGSVTTGEAALLVGVRPSTIRSWVRRGLLAPDHVWRRSNIYLVADVFKAEEIAFSRDTSGNAAHRQ